MDPEKKAFFEEYKDAAIRQQVKYGIPASITLAQMYLESAGGKSSLAKEDNNYFGVKCSQQWLASGKPYSLHSDDRPNEKFCSYGTVEESIEHHSKILLGDRYTRCRQYGADDYKSWATGLKACGYASDPAYAQKLIGDIEAYGLHQYDRESLMAASRGGHQQSADVAVGDMLSPSYSFPLAVSRLTVTSEYGHRDRPTAGASTDHKGIDLKAQFVPVLATENGGMVIEANSSKGRGNYVTVEYGRSDGSKWQVSYYHLDQLSVQLGDTVHAGQQLGISGNSGVSTAPHLHLTVKRQAAGEVAATIVNPLEYLAEISVRGNLGQVVKKGSGDDLLAAYRGNVDTTPTPADRLMAQRSGVVLGGQQMDNIDKYNGLASAIGSDDPTKMLAYLQGQDMLGYSNGGGIVQQLVSTLFEGALMLAMKLQMDAGASQDVGQSDDEQQTPEAESLEAAHRQRATPDVAAARRHASMTFDSEYPEATQSQGLRLS